MLLSQQDDVDVDAETAASSILKNEYTQKEILNSLDKYIDNSVAFEDAQESVNHLHQIVLDIEDKVDLEVPQESMQRIELFEPEEEITEVYSVLDSIPTMTQRFKFSPRDLILGGGS
jgi:L-fucose mutarotase/ribose pyranase (RbsD/FucU family)